MKNKWKARGSMINPRPPHEPTLTRLRGRSRSVAAKARSSATLSPPAEGGQGEGRPRRFKGARRAKSPGRSHPDPLLLERENHSPLHADSPDGLPRSHGHSQKAATATGTHEFTNDGAALSLSSGAGVRASVIAVLILIACARMSLDVLYAADEQPFGIDHRIPWTTSRVVGSPDPPLPYTVEKTFTNVVWRAPIFVTPEPDTESLLIVQQGGEQDRPARILRLRDDPSTDQVETFLVVSNRQIGRAHV